VTDLAALVDEIAPKPTRPYQNDSNARILFWDIETAPMLCAVFDLKPDYISHENIIRDWSILCIGYKWGGESRVRVECVKPESPLDDRAVVAALHPVLAAADVIVHQNGDWFDLPKFNERCIVHGLPPLPPRRTVDTLKIARSRFRFSCNRLDYLGHRLGLGRKAETPRGLWLRCCDGDPAALRQMVKYNRRDVVLLEQVYYKLLPFIERHPNLALLSEDSHVCPNCGSGNLHRDGEERTRVSRFPRFRCGDCGAWSRGGNKPETLVR